MAIKLELITPERVVFRQEFDEVTLPTTEGEISILPHHIPLAATLVPGVVRLKKGEIEEDVAISGGFIEVLGKDTVRVLADRAERANELDLSVIETAKQRAEQVMQEAAKADDTAFAAAAAGLERELARYRVARKHAGRRAPMIDAVAISDQENSN